MITRKKRVAQKNVIEEKLLEIKRSIKAILHQRTLRSQLTTSD